MSNPEGEAKQVATDKARRDALQARALDATVAERVMGYDREAFIAAHERFPRFRAEDLWYSMVPKFSDDLNACFEAQAQCIDFMGWNAYEEALMAEMGISGGYDHANLADTLQELVCATAEERCRAMIACMDAERAMTAREHGAKPEDVAVTQKSHPPKGESKT